MSICGHGEHWEGACSNAGEDPPLGWIALVTCPRSRYTPAPPANLVHAAHCTQAVEGGLTLIFSAAELDEIVAANAGKLVVVFGALTWCRPCKAMQRPVQVGGARGGVSYVLRDEACALDDVERSAIPAWRR